MLQNTLSKDMAVGGEGFWGVGAHGMSCDFPTGTTLVVVDIWGKIPGERREALMVPEISGGLRANCGGAAEAAQGPDWAACLSMNDDSSPLGG